jgi:HK97 family phage prohead protease
MKKKRTIAIVSGLRIREATDGAESRTIEGYALKFGVRSRLLCDWWNNYYEVLEPGCVTREMLDKQDIKLTMFHDRQLVLARSNKGNGTLSYEVDKVGVKFWAEMPHTVDGDKALELVSRGDIAGCSFIYSTDEDDSENAVSYERLDEKGDDGEDILLRHVKRIDNVYDFTITTDPAYEQTDVSKREVEAAGIKFEQQPKPKQIDESKKRERINEVRERIASVSRNL